MRDWLVHIKRSDHASLQAQIREALGKQFDALATRVGS